LVAILKQSSNFFSIYVLPKQSKIYATDAANAENIPYNQFPDRKFRVTNTKPELYHLTRFDNKIKGRHYTKNKVGFDFYQGPVRFGKRVRFDRISSQSIQ